MTEIGRENLVKNLNNQMKAIEKRLDKQMSVMTPLMNSDNVTLVNNETVVLDQIYSEVTDINARICTTLRGEDEECEESVAAGIAMDKIDSKYFGFKAQLCEWLLQRELARDADRRSGAASSKGSKRSSHSSKSKGSHASSKSSACSSKSLKLQAKIAGLKAEAEAMKRTSEAELTARLLKKEEKILKMEAMEKVYAESACSSRNRERSASEIMAKPPKEDELEPRHKKQKQSSAAERLPEVKPAPHTHIESRHEKQKQISVAERPPEVKFAADAHLQEAVTQMIKLQSAPRPELEVFAGDPLEYPYFKTSFQEVVENTVADQRGRLTRLIKYTDGEAKDLIKHMVHADPESCYDKALQMLDREFGNPHLIHLSYIKELRHWENLKAHDTGAYKKLYRFLLKCQTYKMTYNLKELDSTDMIRTVICKFHLPLQERWNRKAVDIRQKNSREAEFSDLLRFIEYEVALLTDPAYSRDALSETNKIVKSNHTLMTASSSSAESAGKCPICSCQHDIESCPEFLSLNVDERHKTVFQKRLCFSCLGVVGQDHIGKNCGNRRKCIVCHEEHPTTLHGGKGVKVNMTNVPCTVISMCVVQVQVWHRNDPENKILVYALLDECSTGTFAKDEVFDALKIPSTKLKSRKVKTVIGEKELQTREAEGLVVRAIPTHAALYQDVAVELPCTYSRPFLAVDPEEIVTPSKIRSWKHLSNLVHKIPEYNPAAPIGLMIGGNCPRANESLEVIQSIGDGPYAKRTRLGWCIIGPIESCSESQFIHSNLTALRGEMPVKDVTTGKVANHIFTSNSPDRDPYIDMLDCMYKTDFNENSGEKEGFSVEDKRFLQTMEAKIEKKGNHYQLPLPLRNQDLMLPNNRIQASSRLSSLKRKLLADEEYKQGYDAIIQSMLSSSYARKADPKEDKPGKSWYVPHFGVHNSKKGKLRAVFDFSTKFKGHCLNNELIPGPNLANLMIGVILRFRKEEVAYMADLEAMYHQVRVPEGQRSLLRFLYWPDGDLSQEPTDYEMCAHPFGAVSSGTCANFALRRTAEDEEAKFGSDAANALRRDFYVDDHLKSVENVEKAKNLFEATRAMCAAGGFNLTKFVSNSSELTSLVPSECRASHLIELDMSKQPIPLERALGVFWCLSDDTLGFRIILQDKPLNRRGVLATVGSVHDPSGIAGPFVLPGRKILQQITKEKGDWDDELPPDLRSQWERWRRDLPQLEKIKIKRCYKPPGFKAVSSSLHSFSDGSDYGYGMVTYLRQVSEEGEVCTAFVMAKSRVVPAKHTTIPRMELVAAVVSAEVTALVKEELDMVLDSETYWVDSTVVLGYIQNDTKRPRTFVANRRNKIRNLTDKRSWNKVDTKENPADHASRGLSVHEEGKVWGWLNGPGMLRKKEDPSKKPRFQGTIPDDDPEIQTSMNCNSALLSGESILSFLENLRNWLEMKLVLARAMVFLDLLRKRREKPDVKVDDLAMSEKTILRMLQVKHYAKEREVLQAGTRFPKSSTITKLDPFLDEDQLLRVGGRLRKSHLPNLVKHPIILPKKEPIVLSLIQHHHEEIGHLGRTSTLGEVRSHGYWAINGGSQVRKLIDNCRRCKELRGQPESQKMADLPLERVTTAEPPFTYCGSDAFGPYIIKDGRKEVKRYGIIFTCYSCRGVHIETTVSMDTDSFILALRRFLSRRGPVRSIRSDNGGNFVGVEEEMRKGLSELDHDRIKAFLIKHSCDWIEWEKNPPESSHMGGVWERQIRTVKNVLSSLLKEHSSRLNDESLRTLLVEVEAIVNSRPLAVDNLHDETSDPLTPNHLLTMKSKVLLPPPGVFQRADIYCRKRWRAVQHLANEFWQRFSKEYVRVSQVRQRWNSVRRNVAVDDIVLIVDKDAPRNRWCKGRVVEVFPGEDGLVRHVCVRTSSSSILKRPITKLIVLSPAEERPN